MSSQTPRSIVLVGGGLASVAAIETLRAEGYEGRICLVSEEATLPYDRPPLSKGFLSGQSAALDILLHGESWYRDQRVDLELGTRVKTIEPANRRVLAGGARCFDYDKLLIAVGARARSFDAASPATASRIRYLRTVADAEQIRASVTTGSRVALIGGGVVGLEVAATLARLGCQIVVLESADRIMARFFPSALSAILAGVHTTEGVKVRLGIDIERVDTMNGDILIRLRNGEAILADVLIVGIGVMPNSEMAAEAGLSTRLQGIEVDVHGQTAAEGVYAAGDVAAFPSRDGTWVRWENWTHARLQAATVARHMLGKNPPGYAEIPWIWSDQYDLNIQVTGSAVADHVVMRGGIETGRLTAFHLHGDRIVGATTVNDSRHKSSIRKLIDRAAVVPREQLEDTGCDLKQLVAALAYRAAPLSRESS